MSDLNISFMYPWLLLLLVPALIITLCLIFVYQKNIGAREIVSLQWCFIW